MSSSTTPQIVQSNAITMARYQLTTMEKRIMYQLVRNIRYDKDRRPNNKLKHVLRVQDFKSSQDSSHSVYDRLQQSTKSIIARVFEIHKTDSQGRQILLQASLLTSAQYTLGTGEIELEINKQMYPYLTNLAEGFTKYSLEDALSLDSSYSQRMLEFLSRWKDTGYWYIEIDEFRYMLKIENKYPRYALVKARVLEVAKRELTEKTGISFTYEEVKKGRSVIALKFYITDNFPHQVEEPGTVGSSALTQVQDRLVREFQQTEVNARRIVAFYKDDLKPLHKVLYQAHQRRLDGKVENMGAYLWKILSNEMGM